MSQKAKILLIEDDPYFRTHIKSKLANIAGIQEAGDFASAKNALDQSPSLEVAIIDMNLHGQNVGLTLLKLAKKKNIFSLILTDSPHDDFIKAAFELGADYYLTKDQCEIVVESIIKKRLDQSPQDELKTFLSKDFLTQDTLLINDISFLRNHLSQGDPRPLMIIGEEGVGKSVVAKFFHSLYQSSPQAQERRADLVDQMRGEEEVRFRVLDVPRIPEQRLESEFFGHVKGAFQEAYSAQEGKFKQADGGTLLIREITALPLAFQEKLLEALEKKSFRPLGSSKVQRADFKLICTTSEDIYKRIQDGSFRVDLFHRLNGLVLQIPPLRNRKKDIPLLINEFLNGPFSIRSHSEGGPVQKIHIKQEALKALTEYSWPGNVRELKSVMESLARNSGGIIGLANIPQYIIRNQERVLPSCARFLPEEHINYLKVHGYKKYIHKVEAELVKEMMEVAGGSMTTARRIMGLSHTGFYRLFKRGEDVFREERNV